MMPPPDFDNDLAPHNGIIPPGVISGLAALLLA